MRSLVALSVLAVACLLLIAGSAAAQVSIGTGGTITLVERSGHLQDAGDLWANVEYQLPLTARHWLGAVVATDGGSFSGTVIRWYYGSPEALVFPGLGFGMYLIGDRHEYIREATAVLGAELVLELHIPVAESTLPLTIRGGWYPAVAGDRVSVILLGAEFSPKLFQAD